jgi:hypothetical protein
MLAILAAVTVRVPAWSGLAVHGNARERRDLQRLQTDFVDR